MNSQRPYSSPQAFRRALTDRLKVLAAPEGLWPLADLQRQFAYDRLLTRLYLLDDNWVVKGATALLARHIAVRHTVDIDIYRATTRDRAERDLRDALMLDAGDWFIFEAGHSTPVADGANGLRVPIAASVGATRWASFHVDVVAEGIRMTGVPDRAPALTAVEVPGLAQPDCLAYPLVDHVADKIRAMFERHGVARHPSTRYKDLVDLVALVGSARVEAFAQHRALLSEAERCGITLPRYFDVPDRDLWEPGYRAEARRAVIPVARTLDDALAAVRPFVDPVLRGTATGTWDPKSCSWRG